jgi:hypothetical protein
VFYIVACNLFVVVYVVLGFDVHGGWMVRLGEW